MTPGKIRATRGSFREIPQKPISTTFLPGHASPPQRSPLGLAGEPLPYKMGSVDAVGNGDPGREPT
jgi:hypothetical protein